MSKEKVNPKIIHYTISLIIIGVVFNGCIPDTPTSDTQLNERKVRTEAEKYLQATLNDPSSYQFISLKYYDTMYQIDNLNSRAEYFTEQFDFYESIGQSAYAQKYKLYLSKLENLVSEIGEGINDVACHVYEFNFRSNNAMGGLVISNSRLYISPNYEVNAVATTEGQQLIQCNELEEYYDIVRAN